MLRGRPTQQWLNTATPNHDATEPKDTGVRRNQSGRQKRNACLSFKGDGMGELMAQRDEYSFCESVTATSISPWCIRRLEASGRHPGGGIDTGSLCGRVKEGNGWDIPVSVTASHPQACRKCVAVLVRGENRPFPN